MPARLTRPQLILLDVVASLGLAMIAAIVLASTGSPVDHPSIMSLPTAPLIPDAPRWLLMVLAAAMTLPVAVRRLWPATVFTVICTATLASILFNGHNDWFIAAGMALYLVAINRPSPHRTFTIPVAIVTAIALLCLTSMGAPSEISTQLVSVLLVGPAALGVAWTLGQAVRGRREATAEAARRLAAQEVVEERLRIARELHDVVAHTMSLIAVRAQVASHVSAKRPEVAAEALTDIVSAAKGSLTEMRYILGVLRSDSPLEPVGGLADLAPLVDRAAQAGVTVTMTTVPDVDLPAGIELAAYRIIQEAVTNVMKHASPTTCRVVMSRRPEVFEVTVTDDGPAEGRRPKSPQWTPSTGHGITGMAERVAAFDGEFHAGPSSTGFTVHAVLPLPAPIVTEPTK